MRIKIHSLGNQRGRKWGGQSGGVGADCGLHPLIHSRLESILVQGMVICQCRQRSPY